MSLPPVSAPPHANAPERPESAPNPRQRALERAAATSRTPFKTLVAIATAESNFDVDARNRKSSAAGPFQMTERTWLQLVRRYGAEVGRPDLASLVTSDAQGRAAVSDESRARCSTRDGTWIWPPSSPPSCAMRIESASPAS